MISRKSKPTLEEIEETVRLMRVRFESGQDLNHAQCRLSLRMAERLLSFLGTYVRSGRVPDS